MSERGSSKKNPDSKPNASSTDAHLPPRPTEAVTSEPAAEPTPTKRVDPVLDLYNALQSSKDKKAAHKPPPPQPTFSMEERKQKPFPSKSLVLTLIVIIFAGFTWSAFKLLHRSNKLSADLALTPAPSAAPIRTTAVAPVVKPPTPAVTPHLSFPSKPATIVTPPPISAARPNFQVNRDSDHDRRKDEDLDREHDRDRDHDRDVIREKERDRDQSRDRDPRYERETDREPLAPTNPGSNSGTEAGAPTLNPTPPPPGHNPHQNSSEMQ